VLDAYGWPHDISDSDILERLLALVALPLVLGGLVLLS
jgi:hypothetical protein